MASVRRTEVVNIGEIAKVGVRVVPWLVGGDIPDKHEGRICFVRSVFWVLLVEDQGAWVELSSACLRKWLCGLDMIGLRSMEITQCQEDERRRNANSALNVR
jgi:hypothetical protein